MDNARPYWLPSHVNIDTWQQNKHGPLDMTCDVNHGNKQTKCSLYKCSFYWPAGLLMAWSIEQSGRKNTGWPFSTHFPLQSVRVITQDMVEANSLQRLTVSIVAGIKAHLPHIPLFLIEPHIGCQKCDTVMLTYHCPRYTGSYETPTGPG